MSDNLDITKMDFGVAVDIAFPNDASVIGDGLSRRLKRRLDLVSKNDRESDYAYLGDEGSTSWQGRTRQRQYLGVLPYTDFKDLLGELAFVFETENTGGILGAPWSAGEWYAGLAPAVAFYSEDQHVIASAYVTPLVRKCECPVEPSWEDVVAVLREACVGG